EDREVDALDAGRLDRPARSRAGDELGGPRKRARVESMVDVERESAVRIADLVRPRRPAVVQDRAAGDREMEPCLVGHDGIDLPTAQDQISDGGRVRQEVLPLAEWELERIADRDALAHVVGRKPAIETPILRMREPALLAGRPVDLAAIADRLRPGVGAEDAVPPREALLEPDGHRAVEVVDV